MSRFLRVIALLVGVPLAALLLGSWLLIKQDLSVDSLVERYTDTSSQWIEIQGMPVHVQVTGPHQAPAVLLIHGTFSSLHTWQHWVDVLSEQYRVISLDLPGFGLTGPHPAEDYSLAATLALFETLRDHLMIERWVVAGNSLGAGYALAYAQHFPERIVAVGLLNGGRIRFSQTEFDARRQEIIARQDSEQGESPVRWALSQPWLRSLISVATPAFLVRAGLKEVYADPTLVDDALVRRYLDLLRREGNRRAFLDRVSGSRNGQFSLLDPLPPDQLVMPILIQWGAQDRWIPLGVGQALAEALPSAMLLVYPELGHVPMEEAGQKTGQDFKRFLTASIGHGDQAPLIDETN